MKSQQTAIKFLAVTALLLLAAVLFVPSPIQGQEAVLSRDGEMLVATYPSSNGNDALYITDTGKGKMVVLTWDNTSRSLQPSGVIRLAEGFK
jgi:hypothetical protein